MAKWLHCLHVWCLSWNDSNIWNELILLSPCIWQASLYHGKLGAIRCLLASPASPRERISGKSGRMPIILKMKSMCQHHFCCLSSLGSVRGQLNLKRFEEQTPFLYKSNGIYIQEGKRPMVLIAICCTRQLLWWGLKPALSYRHNNESLGVGLIPCPLINRFSLEPMTCLTMNSWPQ